MPPLSELYHSAAIAHAPSPDRNEHHHRHHHDNALPPLTSPAHRFDPFMPLGENRRRTSSTTTAEWTEACSPQRDGLGEYFTDAWNAHAPSPSPSQSQSRQQQRQRRKAVRFSTHCYIVPIEKNRGNREEIRQRWYSQDEYDTFKRDASHTLFLSDHHPHHIDEEAFTFRGLEGREERLWKQRRTRRQHAIQVVLAQQQQGGGDSVHMIISTLQKLCQLSAMQQVAQRDAMEAMRYQQELPRRQQQRQTQTQAQSKQPMQAQTQQQQSPRSPAAKLRREQSVPSFDDCWLADLNATLPHSPAPSPQAHVQRDFFSDDFSDAWLMDVA
mmetsp:Transcript_4370/g.12555  ORF Transcript_4370/g.12555 Transcript_4370/m.12555 type:complete len:327 (-) Transcript_4370:88-1068(-)|eukprot:CAMPEP_0119552066 /NCGR_PEP_ID=MMETSP1352-20130426/5166_1 /TAXON_ID=265584 /ORGANISM="Stauroneis constricta, Strain CCMP1120" /LENGTH=326 /DNA_ID=CAMNT_0007598239 /DNA_START=388 /DNA_END=1368 /DNA_ORIENTATION=-